MKTKQQRSLLIRWISPFFLYLGLFFTDSLGLDLEVVYSIKFILFMIGIYILLSRDGRVRNFPVWTGTLLFFLGYLIFGSDISEESDLSTAWFTFCMGFISFPFLMNREKQRGERKNIQSVKSYPLIED